MGYGKVERRIWNDRKFMELTDDGKLVFFMLLTHPHMTSVGAMRATMPGLSAEIGWPVERFRNGFETVSKGGMAEFDEASGMVSLPKYLKHNAPANPNVVKGWLSALELLPECELKRGVINRCINRIETVQAWVSEGLAKQFRNMEQEQYQEKEQKQTPTTASPKKQEEQPQTSSEGRARTKLTLTELPVPWRAWAVEHHPEVDDLDAQFRLFADHHAAKGSLMADWPASWRTWLGREAGFRKRRGGAGGAGAQRALEAGNEARTAGWTPPEGPP